MLHDYAKGLFPPTFPDQQQAYLAEKSFRSAIPGLDAEQVGGRVGLGGEVELQAEQVWPAVHDQDRRRIRVRSAAVHEVQGRVVDVGEELRVGVQPVLPERPVEVAPGRDE